MIAERGIIVDHASVSHWVIRLIPFLNKAFRLPRRTGVCMDKTYNKIKLHWKYRYHTMDTAGHTITFLMTDKRNTATTLLFFARPLVITANYS
ncbi:DDE-type integrase/transposase/recombinase [Rahnella variigena]|uniref:DDE-type integrase/transposase/recombinase n=2 Tax=Rahnella TaxID=34037 RepID=UPI003F6E4323